MRLKFRCEWLVPHPVLGERVVREGARERDGARGGVDLEVAGARVHAHDGVRDHAETALHKQGTNIVINQTCGWNRELNPRWSGFHAETALHAQGTPRSQHCYTQNNYVIETGSEAARQRTLKELCSHKAQLVHKFTTLL